MTPLMWSLAAMHEPKAYVERCRLLLERGAGPAIRAGDGKNAWWWANHRENKAKLLDPLGSIGAVGEGGA